MRKSFLISLALVSALVWSCKKEDGGNTSYATHVILNKETLNMYVGQTETLTAKVLPESFSQAVIWTSLDTSLVKVKGGVVEACKNGVTYVVATSSDGLALSSCLVNVNPPKRYDITVTDEYGIPVNSVYAYPGYSTQLNVTTSDQKQHTFTWESSNPDAFTVDGGLLQLKYVSSTAEEWLYYGKGNITMRTDDGYGLIIPVVSNIRRSIWFDAETMSIGSIKNIEKETSHVIAAAYFDGEEDAVIPAGQYTITSSDTENYTLAVDSDLYVLTSGKKEGTENILTLNLPNGFKITALTVKVDINYPITAQCVNATSSTLAFKWTHDGDAAEDVSKPYTISLYGDAACSELVVSYLFPADADCWSGKIPCFVFAGLDPDKTYYFVATDTAGAEPLVSNVASATTGKFTNVAYNAVTNPQIGDIILAENFNEWGYGVDGTAGAAGFFDNNHELKIFSGVVNPDDINYKTSSENSIRLFNVTKIWDTGKRIADWGFAGNSSNYLHAGFLRCGVSSSGRTHLVTPKLAAIPNGKLASVEVTVKLLKYDASDNDFGVLVQTGTMEKYSSASNPEPCYKLGSLAEDKVYAFNMTEAGVWEVHTVTVNDLSNANSLAIGSLQNISGKNRFNISEVSVKLTDLYDKPGAKVNASLIKATSSTLSFKWGDSDADYKNHYLVELFKNSACTELQASFDISAENRGWNKKQPKLVIAGLTPSTPYWFRVTDSTNFAVSSIVSATTEDFTVYQMPSSITQAGVVYAEDFGELCWDADYLSSAAGYMVDKTDDFSTYVNAPGWFRYSGEGSEKELISFGTALGKSSRLNGWAVDSKAYVHPGYIKLGTASAKGWVLTPQFTVPAGKKAIVTVSVTVTKYSDTQEAKWAIVALTPALANVTEADHKSNFTFPEKVAANYQEVEITNVSSWQTVSVSGLELHQGDRIAFGARDGASSTKGRANISDITVTVTNIVDE